MINRLKSVPTSFMKYIFSLNNGELIIALVDIFLSYFVKYGRLAGSSFQLSQRCQLDSLRVVLILKGDTGLQVPPGINAANLES